MSDLKLSGGKNTVFFEGEVGQIECDLPLRAWWLDWSPVDELRLSSARFRLKSGGDEEMAGIFSQFLQERASSLNSLTINSLDLSWGYSRLNHGSLQGTSLRATRSEEGWQVQLRGGNFAQNWLRGLRLEEADLVVGEEGIKLSKARFTGGNQGELVMTGSVAGSGASPLLNLKVKMRSMPLGLLAEAAQIDLAPFIAGELGGEFVIEGNLDRPLRAAGRLDWGGGERVILRDAWPILKTLSVLDVDRSYRRVVFEEGGFDFSTHRGKLEVENLRAGSQSGLLIKGGFHTRYLNQQEAAKALQIELTKGGAGALDISSAEKLEVERFSLGASNTREGGEDEEGDSLDLADLESSVRQVNEARLREEMRTPVYEGELQLGVPPQAFRKFPELKQRYLNAESELCWIPLTLASRLSAVSEAEADRLLEESRRQEKGTK
ncbi:MAG: hypothetical protein ACQKBY_03275 [Verrucomicrobiales bacterium]